MTQPKSSSTTVDGYAADTRNSRLAAYLLTLGILPRQGNPYTIQAGDGLAGRRVTWHFSDIAPDGTKTTQAIGHWIKRTDSSMELVKQAFAEFDRLKQCAVDDPSLVADCKVAATCSTPDSRMAAGIATIGHRMLGKTRHGDTFRWHFPQSAGTDMAAWDGYATAHELPDTDLCIIRATMENHRSLVEWTKKIQYARVTHKGRAALIGADSTTEEIEKIEKILFR